MQITIQPLHEADFEATDQIIMAAYNITHSRKEALVRYRSLPCSQAFVAKHSDLVVGFGGTLNYGPFAYIGLMSVHPALQRQGIGHVLLEHLLTWLDEQTCPSMLLDATPLGAPLYRHFQFVEDDQTMVMHLTRRVSQPLQLSEHVAPLRMEEWPALLAFDTPHFGAGRAAVLASYRYEEVSRVLVAHAGDGAISGYLIAQARTLGPWVATNAESAEYLLQHALTLPFDVAPGVFVSAHNIEALRLLTQYGFQPQRVLSHMRRGKPLKRTRQSMLYGQSSLGLG